jgi:sugar-specific transcriptional regulator TrmB
MDHDVERLIDQLKKAMNLTTYEAKLYLALLEGAENPRDASIKSGVPLPRIYDVVKMLEVKGFVVQEPGGWYRPLPPRAVAASVLAKIEEDARRQALLVNEAIKNIEKIVQVKKAEQGITHLRGIYSLVSIAVEVATESRVIYFTAFKAVKRARELARSIVVSLSDLLPYKKIRVLVKDGASIPKEDLDLLKSMGIEVRYSPCVYTDMMVADKNIIVGYVVGDDVYGISIPGVDLAGELKSQLDIIWEKCSKEIGAGE